MRRLNALLLLSLIAVSLMLPALVNYDRLVGGFDMERQVYPWEDFLQRSLGQGKIPLWNPLNLMGEPFVANPSTEVFYPVNRLIFAVLPLPYAFTYCYLVDLMILGIGTFLLARRLKCSDKGALLAAASLMGSSYIMMRIYAGHHMVLPSAAWIPLTLFLLDIAIADRKWGAAVLSSLSFGMMVLAGHVQSIFHIGIIMVAWTLYRGVIPFDVKNFLRASLMLAFVLAFGLLIGAAQVLPTLELAGQSARISGFAIKESLAMSLEKQDLLSFVMPNALGNPVDGTYVNHGAYSEVVIYVGLLPLAFALLALWRWRTKDVWFLLLLGIGSLILAFGKTFPPNLLVWKYLPLFNLFHIPPRFSMIWALSASLIAGIVLTWLDSALTDSERKIVRIVGVAIVACAIMTFAVALIMQFNHDAVHGIANSALEQRFAQLENAKVPIAQYSSKLDGMISSAINDMLICGALALIIGVLLLWRARIPFSNDAWAFAIIAFAVVNSVIYFYPMLVMLPPEQVVVGAGQLGFLRQNAGIDRIWNNDGSYKNNQAMLFNVASISGYNPLQIQSQKDMLALVSGNSSGLLDLLDVRYRTSKNPFSEKGWTQVFNSSGYVYTNDDVLPRSFVIYRASALSKTDTLAVIASPDFRPVDRALVDELPSGWKDGKDGIDAADIISYEGSKVRIDCDASEDGLLVLSDTYYSAWKAYVDGQEVPIIRAYCGIRAVPVAKGHHSVEFVFDASAAIIGSALSVVALITVAVILLIISIRSRSDLASKRL